jgi:hypothetical protein
MTNDDHCAYCNASDAPAMWELATKPEDGLIVSVGAFGGWRMFVHGDSDLLFIVCDDCQLNTGWSFGQWRDWYALARPDLCSN